MAISEEDHSLYKKTKRRILERKLELDNYVKKCSKVYGFEKQFQDLYKEGVISEIQLAREKKDIKTMIKYYEEDVEILKSSIKVMEDYVRKYESLSKPNKESWVVLYIYTIIISDFIIRHKYQLYI